MFLLITSDLKEEFIPVTVRFCEKVTNTWSVVNHFLNSVCLNKQFNYDEQP